MRILWLCNMPPSGVEQQLTGRQGSGLWMDRTLEGLRSQGEEIRILCRKDREAQGSLDSRCSYRTFLGKLAHLPAPELEPLFSQELRDFQPDVIHIWGTEYAHCLAMVRAADSLRLLDRLVISLQGVISACTPYYTAGLPEAVLKRASLRDRLRKDNILQQQEKFRLRGESEKQALALARHVMGRTDWDRQQTALLAPGARYYICNETLREPFYEGQWRYADCQRHRIFTPSCLYCLKGFHTVLEAFAGLQREYPDAVLAVPGTDPLAGGLKSSLRRDSYAAHVGRLLKKYGLRDKVEFLGHLSPEQMKQQYLRANVFVLPSAIENSPNSLGEAMLLGTPSVASQAGGVPTMLKSSEGILYPFGDIRALTDGICRVFRMEGRAEEMGARGADHARRTHDPENNLRTLLQIYAAVAENA